MSSSNDTMNIIIGLIAISAVAPAAMVPPVLAFVGLAAFLLGVR